MQRYFTLTLLNISMRCLQALGVFLHVVAVRAIRVPSRSSNGTMIQRSVAGCTSSVPHSSIPQRINGVNLGGWLLVERWITARSPIWQGVPAGIESEYHLMQYLGQGAGNARFKQHRDTFITEADFKAISEAGLNTVRIPVGYWIRPVSSGPATTHAGGAAAYLDSALRWAGNFGLKVIVDIHGVMGSQNGDTNSACEIKGRADWGVKAGSVDDTLALVDFLVSRYKAHPAFLGLALLNEPGQYIDLNTLQQYYLKAYGLVRYTHQSSCLLTVSPRINEQYPSASGGWQQFMTGNSHFNVMHEYHRYQVWGFDQYSYPQIMDFVHNVLAADMRAWTGIPLLIGEWTVTMASVLGTLSDDQYRAYAQAQVAAFQPTRGQIYWTWKYYDEPKEWSNTWAYVSSKYKSFV
jgi:glucan 1,3-beta-glucosidase